MQAYAPRDPVAEYWRGEITLRELRVMVQTLPEDSAMHRANPEHRGATAQQQLAFETVDVLNRILELLRAANSADDHTYNPPEPLRRPWQAARQERSAQQAAREQAHARARLDEYLKDLTGGR